jgi:hypothetical protein
MAEFIDTGVLQDGPAHPEAAADAALNEPPRRASPVNHFPRYATRDVEIRSTGPFRSRVYAGGRLPPLKGSPCSTASSAARPTPVVRSAS